MSRPLVILLPVVCVGGARACLWWVGVGETTRTSELVASSRLKRYHSGQKAEPLPLTYYGVYATA